MSSSQKEKKGAEEREQQHGQISNKKRKEIFPYGNYKSYYGYWIGQEMEEDARLMVFKKEWFEGKDCLDIGCNSGIMTIQIGTFLSLTLALGFYLFILGNFNENLPIPLSVSKWIHLNWGDDGLITLFTRVWSLLRLGGIFVLEPQPWTSYEKNYRVSETTKENYRNLMFYPKDFQDLLLDKIGFRKVEDIASSVSGSKTGFNRPILVFHK
ncbi:probable RNA methyltransferase At5g51130 [Malus sylvestris]|uniref:probable RNA methyltransferase At5g51130 n=1 Tax=Malus sylvestris TaxID=3752 RepID=UPI0021ABD4E0|nr:probable RNA methyltransferase At5g51130 [Malus sylvestris]